MSRAERLGILVLLSSFALVGCGEETEPVLVAPDGPDQLVLTLEKFGDPGPGHFALWASGSSQPTLLLRFTISDGAPVTLSGDPIPSFDWATVSLAGHSALLITVESDTTSSTPKGSVLVAGPIASGKAELTMASGEAFGVDLSLAAGSLLLDAPTSADPHDCEHGIWWTDGEGSPGLSLPALPSGWLYEGWVFNRESGAAYSTGRFPSPDSADSDGPGMTAGDQEGYLFPGQDFAQEAGGIPILDLDNGLFGARITVEPEPDISPSPFFLTILERNVAAGTIVFDFENLPALRDSAYYEAWVSYEDGALASLGSFEWSGSRMLDRETGRTTQGFPAKCTMLGARSFLISVENPTDPDPAPSGSFLLAGDIVGESAELTYSHARALGGGLPDSAGHILETPSTSTNADFTSGIWYYVVSEGETTATLGLAPAPSGWVYEGWIKADIDDPQPISTGTFRRADQADSDGAGPYAGPDTLNPPLPHFPGQDYVDSAGARDLSVGDHRAFITIEPENDFSPGTIFLSLYIGPKILKDSVAINKTLPLDSRLDDLPSGESAYSAKNIHPMTSLGDALPRATIHFGSE